MYAWMNAHEIDHCSYVYAYYIYIYIYRYMSKHKEIDMIHHILQRLSPEFNRICFSINHLVISDVFRE